MADYALSGQDLKRHIKFAKEKSLPFAYNPGGPKEEDYFALHRKRSAEQLGKAAKKDGPSAKVAFGEAKVDGRVLELRCTKALPSMARKLKQHLKANKVSMNIRILDESGAVLEEDIEDLPEDPELDADSPTEQEAIRAGLDEDIEDDAAEEQELAETDEVSLEDEPEAAEAAPEAEVKDDPSDVVAGLKRIQPAVMAAPEPVGAKLKEVMTRIVGLLKGGDVGEARDMFAKLEAAVARLPATGAPAPEAGSGPAPATGAAPGSEAGTGAEEPAQSAGAEQPGADDGRLAALRAMAQAVREGIDAAKAPDEVLAKLEAAYDTAGKALDSGNLDQGEMVLERLAEALTRLGMGSESIRDTKAAKDKKKAEAQKEDAPQEAEPDDTPIEEAGAQKEDAPEPAEAAPAAAPEDDGRLAALRAMAQAVRDGIDAATVPDEVLAKLEAAYDTAGKALDSGNLDQGETVLERLAEALTRLGMATDSIRDTKAEKDRKKAAAKAKEGQADEAAGKDGGSDDAKTEDDAEDKTGEFDQKAHDLKDKVETLRTKMIAQFGMELQSVMDQRLDRAVEDLDAGTYSSAGPAMAFVTEAMRLQDAIDALMPDFARAASTGAVEDVDRMRILFNSATEMVAGPDHARAWKYLAQVQEMIRDGADRNVEAFLRDIPEDARPFAISRLAWTSARTQMKGELDRLRDSIVRTVGGDPEYQEVIDNLDGLYTHIEGLDLRLAEKLDEVVNAEPGIERETRKAEARAVLEDYRNELGRPFFQDVDGSNGFANVSVAATARSALGDIDRVLAA